MPAKLFSQAGFFLIVDCQPAGRFYAAGTGSAEEG
ncbi:hypothetical protein MEA186_14292 [Mesorhizobium amorphae CCNWGS0123]|uniref:Uncharacterized protein n=1 Tax=Mesorhizobium amorphae CCNWGS0123 TaxID=1082933 RepID=G6YA86_9HYPH|nr:hypothetical protein MEA186_14292 [Mesorhizobium amorphae CCNWGS0123]